MNKQIDYEKVQKINNAIDKIWKRIDEIDESIKKDTIPFSYITEEMQIIERRRIESLLDERKQLFETYQKDLKELEACYEDIG